MAQDARKAIVKLYHPPLEKKHLTKIGQMLLHDKRPLANEELALFVYLAHVIFHQVPDQREHFADLKLLGVFDCGDR